jgi:general secretion pathway protein F
MAVFEFRGVDGATGKQVRGVRDAENAKVLRAALRRDGILLTLAHEEAAGGKAKSSREVDLFKYFRRISGADIAVLTRQLATLVRAGIPLVDSIGALVDQIEKEELKRVLTVVREKLNEGTSFAKTLEQHPKAFPPIFVNMVAAGEASGTLEQVLERLADFMESQARLRSKVSAALAYPALMAIIGTLLISVLMVAVVPKVTAIFESLDRALPWYTQVLIGVSNFLAGYWWLFGTMVGGGVWYFRRWKKTTDGRMRWDSICLKTPVFGRLLRMLAVARFSKTLATLLSAGVPLLKAMEIVKNVLDNALLEKVVQEAAGSIREGESIAEPLRRSGQFPPIVTHMISVGEKSGQLEQMLESVAESYDAQVETNVQALTSLLEPLMIVVMGGAVGFIAFAIMMPLIQMNEFVQ